MRKSSKAKSSAKRPAARGARRAAWWAWLGLLIAGVAGAFWFAQRRPGAAHYTRRAQNSVTFNKDIAPIIFEQCAGCHRPGEAGPFNLISYAEVTKRAVQIVEVTQKGIMPPWLPEDGHEALLGRRRLSVEQLGLFQQWAEEGTPEGRAADLPALPKWTEGWQLGPPDLVVTMTEAYTLPAEGKDVYRNFVIPTGTKERRFVRGVELRPSSKSVHHAFIRIDATDECRRHDAKDPGPGFGGMESPAAAETPAGQFLGWQPGRGPALAPDGLAWTLPASADIVLLMHLQPLGKAERLQPSIGFYFTDIAPTNTPAKLGLKSFVIDIPAGATNHLVEKDVTLPVDVDLLAVLPHAHYLGKRLEGYALLPDGTRKTLLLIPEWDFNWQSDYRFVKPVFLPKDTRLAMRYSFDNSTNNPRNPQHPPSRVRYGLQTTNEMSELHFQMLAHRPTDQAKLNQLANRWARQEIVEMNQQFLRDDPTDAEAMVEIAKVLFAERDYRGTEELLRRAVLLRPDLPDVHYSLGNAFMSLEKIPEAEQAYLQAARLDAGHFKARNNAGLCALRQGKLEAASAHFQAALRLHPGDTIAQANLDLVTQAMRGESPGK